MKGRVGMRAWGYESKLEDGGGGGDEDVLAGDEREV